MLALGAPATASAAPPAPTIVGPAQGSTSSEKPATIFGGAEDTTDTVMVHVSGEGVSQDLSSSASSGTWSVQTSLPDGTYTAQAQQTNSEGESSSSVAVTFTVDTTGPEVTLAPVSSPTNSHTPTLSGTGGTKTGDLPTVVVQIFSGEHTSGPLVEQGEAALSSGTWKFTPSALPDGTYTAEAFQQDSAGNVSGSTLSTFRIDTVAPALSVTSPKAGEALKSPRVIFSGSTNASTGDPTTVTVEVFSGSSASGSPEQTLEGHRSSSAWSTTELHLTNGTYTVRAKELDAAGNLGESAAVTFSVASTAPGVTLTKLPEYTNNTQPSFSGSADTSEATPKVTLRIFRGSSASGAEARRPVQVAASAGAWSATVPQPLVDGTYTAQAEQAAESGPPGVSATTTFTVDTVAPAPTLSAPGASTGQETLSGSAGVAPGDRRQVTVELFSGSAAEGQPVETITVNASGNSWSASLASLNTGEYTALARQSDEAGNSGVSAPASFNVTAPPPAASPSPSPPTASFTWVPASPRVGESVSLVSNSTDASSTIGVFAWDMSGTGQFVPGASVATTSFTTVGAHIVHLRATDANGLSGVASRTIVVGAAPAKLMQPFPIVRIAGSETGNGVRVRLLTVQAPVSTKIVVTCSGPGCKKSESRLATTSASTKLKAGAVMLTFKRFERSLRAGVVLQIRVTKSGQIGKFTSFKIRRHKLPLRSDACLRPASSAPSACPTS
ncbi:MAG TPA: Ig-like domain-containing protein [Solirubrobacteraceae bacterium]|nr:Ig-like domain-containing protein [Solirubrobacteraceae bacterium]